MKSIGIAYLVTVVVLVASDFVWLSIMADRRYRPVMGDMLLEPFRLSPAVALYLLYVGGMVLLAVRPGVVSYATCDLTNQSTLKN